jgi:hypothetical protein
MAEVINIEERARAAPLEVRQQPLIAKFEFTLTEKEVDEWQAWLLSLPSKLHGDGVWQMLDKLSHPTEWTRQ